MPLIQTHLICIYGRTHIKGDLIPFQRISQDFAVTTGLHSSIYFCPLKWIPRSWPLTPTKSIFWLHCCLQPMVDMARSHHNLNNCKRKNIFMCMGTWGIYAHLFVCIYHLLVNMQTNNLKISRLKYFFSNLICWQLKYFRSVSVPTGRASIQGIKEWQLDKNRIISYQQCFLKLLWRKKLLSEFDKWQGFTCFS